MSDEGEHRATRSNVTGEWYCIYDGEDWPCAAFRSDLPEGDTT